MENQPHSLFFTLIQLAVVQPTAVNISATGFGFAICQVCNDAYFFKLNMTFYNNYLVWGFAKYQIT